MPSTPLDCARSAAFLLQAWRSGERLESLPDDLKPQNLDQGYAIQDAFFQAAAGARGGWKLGVGSIAGMRAAKLERPLIGQLDRARCHSSGIHLPLPNEAPVTIECEIAFVLGRDLPPQLDRQIEAADIGATCMSFEIVRSRFVDRKRVGWPSFVADNVGFEALVVSEPLCVGLDRSLLQRLAKTAVVQLDGKPRARGLFGEVATDPLASLSALYTHAAERGQTLRAGDIVTTGAMCEPFDLEGVGHRLCVDAMGTTLAFSL